MGVIRYSLLGESLAHRRAGVATGVVAGARIYAGELVDTSDVLCVLNHESIVGRFDCIGVWYLPYSAFY
jgi:hypothetical protein